MPRIASDEAYRYEAKGRLDENDFDFDDKPVVSRAPDLSGAYVACWVWVSADEAAEAAKVME